MRRGKSQKRISRLTAGMPTSGPRHDISITRGAQVGNMNLMQRSDYYATRLF